MIDDSEFLFIPNGTDVCFSGGCKGADQVFGDYAEKAGHRVYHFSFQNHKWDKLCNPETIVTLNAMQLSKADSYLREAGKYLGRSTGSYEYVKNLLRRNYYQIALTDRVYAITPILDNLPSGGTGWAVAMAIQRNISEIYVYDVNKLQWYKHNWLGNNWIEQDSVPRPEGKYTGIGSHDLTPEGRKAIGELYGDR